MTYKNIIVNHWKKLLLLFLGGIFCSCEDNILPEEGSIEDLTLPEANFDYGENNNDYLTYSFSNLSSSATDFFWDFGDGNTSTENEPEHTFPQEGDFEVSLTVADKLGVESVETKTISVVQPEGPIIIVPEIIESGFEAGTLDGGTGDGNDAWTIAGANNIGLSTSVVRTGNQAARIYMGVESVAYQELTVTPNVDYRITLYYTLASSPAGGYIRLAVLGNKIEDASEAEGAIIASIYGDDQTSTTDYTKLTLLFNPGASDTVAIWLDSNNIAEGRVDDITIEHVE